MHKYHIHVFYNLCNVVKVAWPVLEQKTFDEIINTWSCSCNKTASITLPKVSTIERAAVPANSRPLTRTMAPTEILWKQSWQQLNLSSSSSSSSFSVLISMPNYTKRSFPSKPKDWTAYCLDACVRISRIQSALDIWEDSFNTSFRFTPFVYTCLIAGAVI